MASLAELSVLKQLNKEELADIIKEGLFQAISKKLTEENELKIIADFSASKVCAKFYKIVSERDETMGEITLEDARYYHDEDSELGDRILVEIPIHDF